MGAVLTLGTCRMSPNDVVRIGFDWSSLPELTTRRWPNGVVLPPGTITSVTVSCSVPPGGTGTPPGVSGVRVDDPCGLTSAVFSLGQPGAYDATWVVTISDGSVFSRTGVLLVLPGPAMTIGRAAKASADVRRFAMSFLSAPELDPCRSPRASITSVSASCTAADGVTGTPPTLSGVQIDTPTGQVSAVFAGGTAGQYDATFTVTLNDADGTVLSRVGPLVVV